MKQRAWWLFLVAMAPLVGLYLFGPAVLNQGPVFNAIGLTAVVAILVGVRINRPSDRRPWYLFAFGQALFVAGDVGQVHTARGNGVRAHEQVERLCNRRGGRHGHGSARRRAGAPVRPF